MAWASVCINCGRATYDDEPISCDPCPCEIQKTCRHPSHTQDGVTGECHCDRCGKMLIDSIGRVLEN